MNIHEVLRYLLEQEEQELRPTQIYVDMDGVLADFDRSIDTSSKVLELRRILKSIQERIPEFQGKTPDELKVLLSGYLRIPSHKALKNALYDYNQEIYNIAGKQGFFRDLEEMPGARRMMEVIVSLTGKLPHILTAPVRSEYCQPEKEEWIAEHFDGLYDQFYCQADKEAFASPDALLIDDRIKNISVFRNAGGQGILHRDPELTIKKLEKIYGSIPLT